MVLEFVPGDPISAGFFLALLVPWNQRVLLGVKGSASGAVCDVEIVNLADLGPHQFDEAAFAHLEVPLQGPEEVIAGLEAGVLFGKFGLNVDGVFSGEAKFLFKVLFGFGESFAKRGVAIRFPTAGEDQIHFVGSSAELVEQVLGQSVVEVVFSVTIFWIDGVLLTDEIDKIELVTHDGIELDLVFLKQREDLAADFGEVVFGVELDGRLLAFGLHGFDIAEVRVRQQIAPQLVEAVAQGIAVVDEQFAENEELRRVRANEYVLSSPVEKNGVARFVDEVVNDIQLVSISHVRFASNPAKAHVSSGFGYRIGIIFLEISITVTHLFRAALMTLASSFR